MIKTIVYVLASALAAIAIVYITVALFGDDLKQTILFFVAFIATLQIFSLFPKQQKGGGS